MLVVLLFVVIVAALCLNPFHLMSQRGQRRGRRDAEDRGEGGERLQGGLDTSSLTPLLSSLPSLPSLPPLSQAYRARLHAERPVRHSRAEDPGELSASQAVQLLLHTEVRLLERRDRQRLANRIQLQEMTGRLDELVLIPP